MTQRARNTLILTGFIGACICGAVCIAATAGVFMAGLKMASFVDMLRNRSMGINYLPGIYILTIAAIASGVAFQFYFRKNPSYELFFFMVAVLALSLEGLRSLILLLAVGEQSAYYQMLIVRTVYFSRYVGAFCLFCSGLTVTGAQSQRIEVMLGSSFVLALAFSSVVPVDATAFENVVSYRGSSMTDVMLPTIIFEAFAVVNFLFGGYAGARRECYSFAAAIGCFALGKELLFYAPDLIFTLVGGTTLLFGMILFLKRIHHVYQWR
ncbi:MAG TPA: hypothetical protein PLG43_04350 [Spirochaetia bacterium]|nr:hypothetical protein [Spirochaetia bacterium]